MVVVVVIVVVSDVVSVTVEDVSVVVVVSEVRNVTVEDVSVVIVVVSDAGSVTAEDVSVVVVVTGVGSVTVEDVFVVIVVAVLVGVSSVTLDAVVERDIAVTIIEATLVSGFFGARITKFNSRVTIVINIAKMIKVMEMIQQFSIRLRPLL